MPSVEVYRAIVQGVVALGRSAQHALGARELLQRLLGSGADVADHLGGREAAQAAAVGERKSAREAVEKPRRVKIARAGHVNNLVDRLGQDVDRRAIRDDNRTELGTR